MHFLTQSNDVLYFNWLPIPRNSETLKCTSDLKITLTDKGHLLLSAFITLLFVNNIFTWLKSDLFYVCCPWHPIPYTEAINLTNFSLILSPMQTHTHISPLWHKWWPFLHYSAPRFYIYLGGCILIRLQDWSFIISYGHSSGNVSHL